VELRYRRGSRALPGPLLSRASRRRAYLARSRVLEPARDNPTFPWEGKETVQEIRAGYTDDRCIGSAGVD